MLLHVTVLYQGIGEFPRSSQGRYLQLVEQVLSALFREDIHQLVEGLQLLFFYEHFFRVAQSVDGTGEGLLALYPRVRAEDRIGVAFIHLYLGWKEMQFVARPLGGRNGKERK